MTITIYLGDVGLYLSDLTRSYDENAQLLTANNFSNLSAGTYYTSIADIGNIFNLGLTLQQADKIVYAPPPDGKWTHNDMKKWSEDYLEVFSFRCEVKNYTPPDLTKDHQSILALVDNRKTDSSQLWACGCSITRGSGVTENERYGQLLATSLGLPVSFLSCSASSICWQADQILRSDIRKGDTVVWGMTSDHRFPFYTDNCVKHVKAGNLYGCSIDDLDNSNRHYQNLTSVYQVINFCQKIEAKLILVSVMNRNIVPYLNNTNLIMLHNLWGRESSELFLDLGSDGQHPGPETHKLYAKEIYKLIKNTKKEKELSA